MTGEMKEPYKVVKHFIRTEKSTEQEPQNKYFFSVDRRANKIEIKKAIEEIYQVKVKSVNTMNLRGKMRRVRYQPGRTASWKKAIVTLREGHKIEVT